MVDNSNAQQRFGRSVMQAVESAVFSEPLLVCKNEQFGPYRRHLSIFFHTRFLFHDDTDDATWGQGHAKGAASRARMEREMGGLRKVLAAE
jgi:hypothetical protein